MDTTSLTNNHVNKLADIHREKSFWEKIEYEWKQMTFSVFTVLLKDEEVSIFTIGIFLVIHFLQLLHFHFNSQINSAWNFPLVADNIKMVINYFQLLPYFDNGTFSDYMIFFYVLVGIMVFCIITIFYIRHGINKKKFTLTWPITVVRLIVRLGITILFIPGFSYLASVLNCTEVDGKLVHFMFTTERCWSGVYFIHGGISIIASLLMLAGCLTASLLFFECRPSVKTTAARLNSRAPFLLVVYEAVLVLLFHFFSSEEYQFIILGFLLVGSIVLFVKFHAQSPFFNENVAKVYSAVISVNLWTSIMIVFSRIMETVLFEGSVIAWLIGIPFITLLVISDKEQKVDLLLLNSNKFQSGQEIQDQIRYISKLISWQISNKNAGILLDGFIEIHKQTCDKEDCALKQRDGKNNRLTKAILNNGQPVSEKHGIVIQLLYQMYMEGVKRFPNDASLRIAYAFFLLNRFNNKQQALHELNQAELARPLLDEQFIIYRCKKILEDETAESQNEEQGGLDVISEENFQTQLRLFQASIEKSALLHMEFWSQLSEDNPDLAKVGDVGSKIATSLKIVEENWNRLRSAGIRNAKVLRLYGKFLVEIINDVENGEDLIEKARNLNNVAANKRALNYLNMVTEGDFSNDATPIVFVSGEQDKFGVITNINMSAASLFGYNKTELTNRKVNVLMPQPYSRYHDSFIEHYLNSNESYLIGKHRDRLVFGRNKAGYVFPFYLSLKALPSIMQGIQFVAIFRIEKTIKQTAYVITQSDGTIEGISSSAINMLKIDARRMLSKKTNIEEFATNIIKDKQNVFTFTHANNNKGFGSVTFKYPKDSEYLMEGEEDSSDFNCHLHEITFSNGRDLAGYYFRFEQPMDKSGFIPATTERRVKISNFQFRYEPGKPSVIGEYVENIESEHHLPQVPEHESDSHDEQEETQIQMVKFNAENEDNNMDTGGIELPLKSPGGTFRSPDASVRSPLLVLNSAKRVEMDYSTGIKTMRLVEGKAVEIESISEEGENAEEKDREAEKSELNQQKRQEILEPEDDDGTDFSVTLRSRKVLNSVINDKTPPKALQRLNIAIYVIFVGLIALALSDYLVCRNDFKGIKDYIGLVDLSYQQYAEFMNILSKTRDLYLINITLFSQTGLEAVQRSSISASLLQLSSITQQIESMTLKFSSELMSLYNNPVINLHRLNEDADQRGLSQATNLMISKGIEIASTSLSEIGPNNTDYYFITYNLLNDYYIAMDQACDLFTTELLVKLEDDKGLLAIQVTAGCLLVLMLILLFVTLYKISQAREEILSLFLEIPEKSIKGLYTKCENFISNLQMGEGDEGASDFDEEEDDLVNKSNQDQDIQEFGQRKKKRVFKNSAKTQNFWYWYFIAVLLIIEAIFLTNFLLSDKLLSNIRTLVPEFQATAEAEGFYSYVNNVQRQILINQTFPVMGNSSPISVASEHIRDIYNLDASIHEQHLLNIKIHSQDYVDIFNNIMMVDTCPSLTDYVSLGTCDAFADGTVRQGMAVDITRHFENLRAVVTDFLQYNSGSTWSENTTLVTVDSNTTQNNLLNIMLLPIAVGINTTQHLYIKESFKILRESFTSVLQDDLDSSLQRKLITLILFVAFLVVIFVVFWVPYMSKLLNEIWRTKATLGMVPLSVIIKVKGLKKYLRKLWTQKPAEY